MRKSMVAMLAVVAIVASGCLIWATTHADGQSGGGGTPLPGIGQLPIADSGQPDGTGGPRPGGGQPGGGKKGPMGGGPGGFGGPGAAPFGQMAAGPARPMAWEYRVLSRGSLTELGKESLEAGLNQVGAEGWELVGIDAGPVAKSSAAHSYIFRRPGMFKQRGEAKPAAEQAPKQKAEERLEFRVHRMKHAEANDVARVISDLMITGSKNSLRVVADPTTNQLLLKGPTQLLVEVEALLQRLDVPRDAGPPPPPGPGKKGFKRGGGNEGA